MGIKRCYQSLYKWKSGKRTQKRGLPSKETLKKESGSGLEKTFSLLDLGLLSSLFSFWFERARQLCSLFHDDVDDAKGVWKSGLSTRVRSSPSLPFIFRFRPFHPLFDIKEGRHTHSPFLWEEFPLYLPDGRFTHGFPSILCVISSIGLPLAFCPSFRLWYSLNAEVPWTLVMVILHLSSCYFPCSSCMKELTEKMETVLLLRNRRETQSWRNISEKEISRMEQSRQSILLDSLWILMKPRFERRSRGRFEKCCESSRQQVSLGEH